MGYHAPTDAAMERAISAMRKAGAEVVDVTVPTWGQWDDAELQVLLYEFKAGVEHYLASSGAPVGTLAQVIDYNQRHHQATMPYFGQELLEQARAKGSLGDPAYLTARADARRLARTEGLDATLSAQGLDALIAPATSPAWRTDLAHGDRFLGAGYGLAAVAGTPSVTVPMGEVKGLPVGVVFMGPAWSEPRLLGLAYSFEQATRARKAPRFVASIGADPAPLSPSIGATAKPQVALAGSATPAVIPPGQAATASIPAPSTGATVPTTPSAGHPTPTVEAARPSASKEARSPSAATTPQPPVAVAAKPGPRGGATGAVAPTSSTAPTPRVAMPARPRPRPTTLPGASADQP